LNLTYFRKTSPAAYSKKRMHKFTPLTEFQVTERQKIGNFKILYRALKYNYVA